MSAINMLVKRQRDTPDRLYMWGDVAAYDSDGIVREFQSKLLLIGRFPCAVATMGNMYVGALIKEAVADSACFADLVETARVQFNAMAADGEDIALAIGGWSGGECELWYGGTVMRQPFARLQIGADGYYGGQPPLSSEQWRAIGATSPAQVKDVEQFALKVLEFQRQFTWGSDDGYPRPVHLVGGFAELASLSEDKAELKKIISWPEDCVGELIQPADSAPAGNTPRMSRQQRRAAHARARRAA